MTDLKTGIYQIIILFMITTLTCGCINTEMPETQENDPSISAWKTGNCETKTVILNYTLNQKKGNISLKLRSDVYNKLINRHHHPYYGEVKETYLPYIENSVQDKALAGLVTEISNITDVPDERAEIAITLVQNIPFDTELDQLISSRHDYAHFTYPYAVLYENKGICQSKSLLLAYFLHKLGFKTALTEFDEMWHMAVGVSCSGSQGGGKTGYAIVETTDNNSVFITKLSDYGTPVFIELFDGTQILSGQETGITQINPADSKPASYPEYPNKAEEWDRLGIAAYNSGDYKKALYAFSRSTALDPDSPIGWNNYGFALDGQGRHDEAICAYEKALASDSSFAGAWTNKALALYHLKSYNESLSATASALSINPNDADTWLIKGYILMDSGQKKESHSAFNRAFTLDPVYTITELEKKGIKPSCT